ncbi:MAG: Plug domain-containing protein, partial [Winogradskyella sp.]|nr:Plug domain-containing protein [Winogradskyella sp.]
MKKTKYEVTDFDGNATLDKFNDREIIYFQNLLYEKLELRKVEISQSNYIVYLTPKVEGLKQIVISVSKFEQSKKDIPQSIVALNAKEIALANPQTSADLLDNTGNVFIQKSQMGGGSPMIR